MSDEGERIILRAEVDAEVKRLRTENAALREIVQAVAVGHLWPYEVHDVVVEFDCLFCEAGVDVPDYDIRFVRYEDALPPQDEEAAIPLITHKADCPVMKARALLDQEAAS